MEVQSEADYDDLLGDWSDLEAGLGIVLGSPGSIREFELRIRQYDRWMHQLLQRDTDLGLYLLFQLAANSFVGYSAAHALTCAVLCDLTAQQLKLSPPERDSLVRAALTMNIAMTGLQDTLALQTERLSAQQQEAIAAHPAQGRALLAQLGVSDALWLGIVSSHHEDDAAGLAWRSLPPRQRLARVLRMVDRYAAMISPRKSREGRSSTETVRKIMSDGGLGAGASSAGKGMDGRGQDEVSHALVRAVGLCPPGSYVRLSDGSVAVVVSRSATPNQPVLVVIKSPGGEALAQPRLHQSGTDAAYIQAALASSLVRVELNHPLILRLGRALARATA